MKTYNPQNFRGLYETHGADLWQFLNEPTCLAMMDAATFLERPAVEPLATLLLERFGSEIAQDRMKQFIGHMVRHIMLERGCEIDQHDVRIVRNAIFSTGTRYIRRNDPGKRENGMRITREQREAWARTTRHGAFNTWFDPKVRDADGKLNLTKLYRIAREHGIGDTYQPLNAGQQRMIIGIKIRKRRKQNHEMPY